MAWASKCTGRGGAFLGHGDRPASGRTSASVGGPFGVARPIVRSSPGPWRRACEVWYRNPVAGDGNWIVSVIETDVERDKSVVRAATLSHLYWSIWGGLERSRPEWSRPRKLTP